MDANHDKKCELLGGEKMCFCDARKVVLSLYDKDQEIIRLREIVAYLASCNAATLESLPKSASKSSRRRFKEICQKSVDYFEGKDHPYMGVGPKEERIQWCLDRCKKAIENNNE